MERGGERLKRTRERLRLTYRDVEQASQGIAARRQSDEFSIALSRLADIENKGTVPTVYRLYSLCAIYRLDFDEVLRWYGVPYDELVTESLQTPLRETHPAQFGHDGKVTIPRPPGDEIDLDKTAFLSYLIRNWGAGAFRFLNGVDLKKHRYGFIGLQDRSMYPVLHPGSLVVVDESRRKIVSNGWTSEFDRPIYFLEHREGYACSWCTVTGEQLLIQPHPGSGLPAWCLQWP